LLVAGLVEIKMGVWVLMEKLLLYVQYHIFLGVVVPVVILVRVIHLVVLVAVAVLEAVEVVIMV
jgi:hypothetical protein